jgi:dolichyl-phosphate beta-glucosyltransferase
MHISVVIPAYNEEQRLPKTLQSIVRYLEKKKHEYEIIVVNDGSKDKTAAVVQTFAKKNSRVRLLNNPHNLGKGGTVRRGMLAAKKEWVLFTDADNSTSIEMLDRMQPFLKDHDIIIGSRNVKTSDIAIKQGWFRKTAGKTFPLIVRLLLVRGIKDTQCGFKLFRRSIVKDLCSRQQLSGWAFDAELLYLAQKDELRIKEIGIVWKNDASSKLHFVRDSYRMFRDVLKIKMNDWRGRYR